MSPQRVEQRTRSLQFVAVALGCLAMILVCGCASQRIQVRQYGRMHEVLGGPAEEARARVTLAKAMETPHAFGVGALPGLAGEITILDGQAWVCRPSAAGLHVDGPSMTPTDDAALLTVAHVERWQDTEIVPELQMKALEDFIADRARQQGIDRKRPFPFLIEGELSDLQAHVVNGMCPMKPGLQLAADKQPWRYQLDRPTRARIVGFYAPDSVGNLTHPGTRVHAHVVFDLDGQQITAHVERIAVASGSILRLPQVE